MLVRDFICQEQPRSILHLIVTGIAVNQMLPRYVFVIHL